VTADANKVDSITLGRLRPRPLGYNLDLVVSFYNRSLSQLQSQRLRNEALAGVGGQSKSTRTLRGGVRRSELNLRTSII
jgi:hypothetical protein